MSHIDFKQGVYYPDGGMYKLIEAMVSMAKKRGVKIVFNSPVKSIVVRKGQAKGVVLEDGSHYEADIVISNADMAHTELNLLKPKDRSYTAKYWQKRTVAPSALLMYLGVKKQFPKLKHHNLVFSQSWDTNFKELFENQTWPTDPSFYVCNPNKTDNAVAPPGQENLFVLVPLPATTSYNEDELNQYSDWILSSMEQAMHLDGLKENIVYKKLFCARDFKDRFNSYNGTALGLAHTLKQTAALRPNNKSKKVDDLYYVGANTLPGIGLPMCLISAELVYKRLVGDESSGPLQPSDLQT